MTKAPSTPDRVVCFGAACIDRTFRALGEVRERTSNPAAAERGFGGVARNVAENLARLGVAVSLCAIVGDDEDGRAIVAHLRAADVDTSGVTIAPNVATPQYAAIITSTGDLFVGAAEASALETLTLADLERRWPQIDAAAWLFLDCNVPATLIAACVARRRSSAWRLAIDAVSVTKAQRLPSDLSGVDVLFLNAEEARACGGRDVILQRGAAEVVLSRGAQGVVTRAHNIPALAVTPIDVTGAGDALAAGTLYGLLGGESLEASVELGMHLAALTVQTAASVRQDLSADILKRFLNSAPSALRSG